MKTLKRHFPKNHFISEQVLYRIRSCHEGRQLGYNRVQFKRITNPGSNTSSRISINITPALHPNYIITTIQNH
ncbi:hypothetical protein BGZ97_007732 [Linnemannia gamsii]|uniref:Uncharacterized protein n=1 Tax=Linnemannia gamsii TaxID=64522 RepID=A0A9P6QMN0_9FUNG|nr:hypothetical protein BGZ97_007732 [Linnemannia gamsii]